MGKRKSAFEVPDSELSPQVLQYRRDYDAVAAAFGALSTVGQLELIRFTYMGMKRDGSVNAPLPPELEAIKETCEQTKALGEVGERKSWGFFVDRAKLAKAKDLPAAFEQVAGRLPAGSARADFAAFLPIAMGTESNSSASPEAQVKSALFRSNKVAATAARIVAQSFEGLKPETALEHLGKSSMLLEQAGNDPRIKTAVEGVLTRIAQESASDDTKAGINRIRRQIGINALI